MDTKQPNLLVVHRRRGLTLIEMAIVVAVIAIVAATAAPSFSAYIDARRLEGAATRLAADVQFARSEAVARNRALRLSFHANAALSCWVVHTGSAAQCSCDIGGAAVCTGSAVEIKTVVLPAGERIGVAANVGSLVFDPLHGTSTPTGTLRLFDGRGRAVHHIVNVMGRVRSCSPGAAMPAWRAC
ncbi:MAG: GspH/FimT family pseudopilin [Caldimonas sp.]